MNVHHFHHSYMCRKNKYMHLIHTGQIILHILTIVIQIYKTIRINDNELNPPTPKNFNSPHASSSSRLSLEDAFNTFIQRQSEQNQKFESMLTKLDEEVRETKSHITRLTNSLSGTERGKLPSQTQPNLIDQNLKIGSKDKYEEAKSMTILRSSKEIDKKFSFTN